MSLSTIHLSTEEMQRQLASLQNTTGFLKEPKRILRETLKSSDLLSAQPRTHRLSSSDGASSSLSPNNAYQLVSSSSHQNQMGIASSRLATAAMTPRSQSNLDFSSAPVELDNRMTVRIRVALFLLLAVG